MVRYPTPKNTGGTLIREVISFMRLNQIQLPLKNVYIAVSGGADSVALAHLLVHFGRKVVDRKNIKLLHINHGWRGKDSDADQKFVEKLGKSWKIKAVSKKLPKLNSNGVSLEMLARMERKKIYKKLTEKKHSVILTAHHADDLAETMVWRMMTGDLESHGQGIYFRHKNELRPLLRVRKETLKKYLKEERQKWREDVTNAEGRFLRSKMRLKLMPVLEEIFPKSVENLVNWALIQQSSNLK
jgi:tRNA(Ile)-lysidine synthase